MAVLLDPFILPHALDQSARLLESAGIGALFQSQRIFDQLDNLITSTLFDLITTSCAFVLPMKSLAPIAFPESDQLGPTSELVEVHVARPLASDTRILFSPGEPQPMVT